MYALGVVLYEALASARPFAHPEGAVSVVDALRRAAGLRREGADPLRRDHPEVPPALEAVVRRCLEPDPSDRYQSAGELAADLQAVADDGPLRHAREPEPSRSLRWVRRRRRPLLAAVALVATLVVVGNTMSDARVGRLRRLSEVRTLLQGGEAAAANLDFDTAVAQFDAASKLAEGAPDLLDEFHEARRLRGLALNTREARERANLLFSRAESLRFRLLDFAGLPGPALDDLRAALAPFYVLPNPRWALADGPMLLDAETRARLIAEVDGLLFLGAWASLPRAPEGPADRTALLQALAMCDRAHDDPRTAAPCLALRSRIARRLGSPEPLRPIAGSPNAERSPRACLEWALLCALEGNADWAVAWLERAVRLEPDDFWTRFSLAYQYQTAGNLEEASRHIEVAIALHPDSPWARFNRARLWSARGAWSRAIDDLDRALASATAAGIDYPEARLERGLVLQALGDVAAARAAFVGVSGPGPLARAALLDRARLDASTGRGVDAAEAYDSLLAEGRDDGVGPAALLGRAVLSLRRGKFADADADLTQLLAKPDVYRPDALAARAVARLRQGRAAEAEVDAEGALALLPGPARERLRDRARLAAGHEATIRLDRPEALRRWPVGGRALVADLRAAAVRLGKSAEGPDPLASRLALAVVLAASGDTAAALAEANRAVREAPGSANALQVRARVRRVAGHRVGALADVSEALRLDPDAPRLLALRGELRAEAGDPSSALADLDRALALGADATTHAARASALMALGRPKLARAAWTLALAADPTDARALLGRALAFARTGAPDAALVDLEQAARHAVDDPTLLGRIALAYASMLPERPDRLPRVLSLAHLIADRVW